jgi:hypothetical protein
VVIVRQGIVHDVPPAPIRDLAPVPALSQHLAGARLGDLALALADRSELRVCVVTYEDGTCELQILYTGLPRPAGIADAATFTGPARAALGQIRSIAGDSDLQAAADLIYATLRDADASAC